MIGRRVALVVLLGLLAIPAAAYLYYSGPNAALLPGCLLHRLTGLHCAGCGMTRATYEAFHGNFGAAFRLNMLGAILFPIVLVLCGIQVFAWLRGKPFPSLSPAKWRLGWWMLGIILAFSVLRNIPAWPFTLFAPH